jgi:hypothetical protein
MNFVLLSLIKLFAYSMPTYIALLLPALIYIFTSDLSTVYSIEFLKQISVCGCSTECCRPYRLKDMSGYHALVSLFEARFGFVF